MSVSTFVPALPPVVPPVPVRRFTVEEYHQMIQAGILGEDDDVELLEGWIVPEMPRNPAHDALIAWVHNRVLAPRLREGWFCRGQSAITTPDSEPEPDLALIRGSERDYLSRHPGPADTALAVEVADSSLSRDRSIKARIYAAAGVLFTGSSIWSMTRLRSTPSRQAPTRFPITECARTTSGVTLFRWLLTASSWARYPDPTSCPDETAGRIRIRYKQAAASNRSFGLRSKP